MIGSAGEGVKAAPGPPSSGSGKVAAPIPAWRLALLAAACASAVWVYAAPGVVAITSPSGATTTAYGLLGLRQGTDGERPRTADYEGLIAMGHATGNASREEIQGLERQRTAGLLALQLLVLAVLALCAGALAIWGAQPFRGETAFIVAAALLLLAVGTFWSTTASTVRSVARQSLAMYATVPTWLSLVLFLSNAALAAIRLRGAGSLGRKHEVRPHRSAPQAKTIECPRCAETIKAKATMCRFCNLELPPAAPPASSTLTPSRESSTPSPTIATGLALVLPGLGHMYGRRPVLGVILTTMLAFVALVWWINLDFLYTTSDGRARVLVVAPVIIAAWLLQAAHAHRVACRCLDHLRPLAPS